MGCVQSYFRKAHNAGLSPSSTQASDNPGLIDDESPVDRKKQLITEEQPLSSLNLSLPVDVTNIPVIQIHDDHSPGTNGSSKTGTGHLGPGIAALAASTGTVAILGATADKGKEVVAGVVARADQVREDAATAQNDAQALVGDVQESVMKEAESVKEGIEESVDAAVQEGDKVTQQVQSMVEEAEVAKDELISKAEQERDALVGKALEAKDGVVEKMERAKDDVVEKAEQTKDSLLGKAEQVGGDLVKKMEKTKEDIVEKAEKTKEDLVEKAEKTKEDIVEKAEKTKEDLVEKAEKTKEDIVEKMEQTKEDIVDKAEKTKEEIVEKAEKTKEDIVEKVEQTKEDIVDKAEKTKEEIVEKAEQTKEDLVEKVEKTKEEIVEKAEKTKEEIVEKAEKTKEEIVEKVEQTKEDIVEKVEQTKDDLLGKAEATKEALIEKAVEGKENLVQKVDQAKETVADNVESIKREVEVLVDKADQTKDNVVETVNKTKDDVVHNVEEVSKEAEKLMEKAKQTKDDVMEQTEEATGNLAKKVDQVKEDVVDVVEESVQKQADLLVEKVDQTTSDVIHKVEDIKEDTVALVGNAEATKDDLIESAGKTRSDLEDKVNQAQDDVVNQLETNFVQKSEELSEKFGEAQADLVATADQAKTDAFHGVVNVAKVVGVLAEKVNQSKDDIVKQVEADVVEKSEELSEKVDEAQATADKAKTDAFHGVVNVAKVVGVLAEKVNQSKDDIVNKAESVVEEMTDVQETAEKSVVEEVESVKESVDRVSEDVAHVREIAQKEVDDVVEIAERVMEEAVSTSTSPHDLLARLSRPSSNKSDIRPSSAEVAVNDQEEPIKEAEDDTFPEPPSPEESAITKIPGDIQDAGATIEDQISTSASQSVVQDAVDRKPRVIDVETIVKDTTAAAPQKLVSAVTDIHEEIDVIAAPALEEIKANEQDLADSAATTIQATFRGHHARQTLKKIADKEDDNLDDFPPPPMDIVDELTTIDEKEASESSSENKVELRPVVDVTMKSEPQPSRSESLAESEEKSTLAAESESESLEEIHRGASTLSESTVSLGDSLSALKGSETDVLSVGSDEVADKLATTIQAVTTIQASFRGYQARQNLQNIADEAQMPLPEPLDDLDEYDLPSPPNECDLQDHGDDVSTDTPRSPETGEKLITSSSVEGGEPPAPHLTDAEQLALLQRPQECDELPEHRGGVPLEADNQHQEGGEPPAPHLTDAEQLALLQRPQECDELPEHRGGVPLEADNEHQEGGEPPAPHLTDAEQLALLQRPQECDELPEHRGGVALEAEAASSAEVDDSSLDSAATKIQAGARGYLTRKHMNDTFSTTAPSMTDSQQSVGTVVTSPDEDDAVQTSGSLETEVQRQSLDASENLGVTAVVIANTAEKEVKAKRKARSLDSHSAEKRKVGVKTSSMQCPGPDATPEDLQVWETLQSGLGDAATKIQCNFRGYRTRQKLHRENAVQMPTTSSGTPTTTSESSEAAPAVVVRSSGEFHDMLVLPTDSSVGYDALASRQTSTIGRPPEGHVTLAGDVRASGGVGVAQNIVIKMGKATEVAPALTESREETNMKGESAVNAATKIQAGFRGYKVRKQMRQIHAEKAPTKRKRRSSQSLPLGQEKVRIKEVSLQDRSATKIQAGVRGFLVRKRREEERNAAVKIQAGFRGYKVRRDVKRAPVEK